MYVVDKIENNIVVLENKDNLIEINKKELPKDIKEGDILKKENNIYILDKETTNKIKKDIRSRFNKLKKN